MILSNLQQRIQKNWTRYTSCLWPYRSKTVWNHRRCS